MHKQLFLLIFLFIVHIAVSKDSQFIADSLHDYGLELFAEERYDSARAIFREEIAVDSTRHKAYNNIGVAYANEEYHDSAILWHDAAIQVYPEYAHAYYSQGLARLRLGDTVNAQQSFLTSIELGYSNINALYYSGLSYQLRNDYEEALEYYLKVQSLDFYYPGLHYRIGQCKEFFEDKRAAKIAYKRELKKYTEFRDSANISLLKISYSESPAIIDSIYAVAQTFQKKNKQLHAAQEYQLIAELEPNYPNIHLIIGQLYAAVPWAKPAIGALEKHLEINPDDEIAHKLIENMELFLEEQKKYEDDE